MSGASASVRRFTGLGLVALAALGFTAGAALAQDEIVARGNAAYQEGDFAAALEAYEAVLESGYRSPGLEYNLANAYFKTGDLGRAILHWERARELAPGDEDIQANLDLARSLTVDAVEPLPRFWLFSVVDWWIGLLPAGWLRGIVALGWLAASGGVVLRILSRAMWAPTAGRSLVVVGSLLLLLFAPVMLIRETGVGLPEEGIVLADAVQVRSAPSAEDDLTLFEIHEGTKVRIDQRTAEWLEVVLEDGKVGWVPAGVLEVI